MKKAEIFSEYNELLDMAIGNVDGDEILSNDIKPNNFGIYMDRVVKVDYGRDFWLYNSYIGIMNKIHRL